MTAVGALFLTASKFGSNFSLNMIFSFGNLSLLGNAANLFDST
jgi:hypothetical protein